MIGRGFRKRRTEQPRPAAPAAKPPAAEPRNTGEPVSFAWTEPIERPRDEPPASAKQAPRVVLVGRGPSLAERLALAAPSSTTIAAGAAVLLVAVAGLALMSPSGEQATAGRNNSQYGDASPKTPAANVGLTKEEFAALEGKSGSDENRDPFVGKGYGDAKRAAVARERRAADAKRRDLAARKAAERRAKLAAARAPKYLGDFIYYSDYTPWERLKGTPGGWLQFDGQQTLMVESVTAGGAELFVVSDVEVIDDRGRGYEYSYPLRRLKVKPGAVVRLADYRDVQGDDVTYTLRYRGSLKNPKHHE